MSDSRKTRTIVLNHGDKGGTGKSVVSSTFSDWFAERAPGGLVVIIEGEARNQDVAWRYQGDSRVKSVELPLNDPSGAAGAMERLGTWLERNEAEFVVVNLPANAGDTLDRLSPLFREIADALEYRLAATYSLGQSESAADMLDESLGGGLLAALSPESRLVLYPEFLGKPETFAWHARRSLHPEISEAVFPALAPRATFETVLALPHSYSRIARGEVPDVMVHTRIVVGRWVHAAREALSPLFPDVEV